MALKFEKKQLKAFLKDKKNIEMVDNFDDTELKQIWYNSLSNDKPDYSIYETEAFLVASFDCFKKYSRSYIYRLFRNPYTKDIINSCAYGIDLGNGLGYSTKLFSTLFNPFFCGTQIKNTPQYKFNKLIGNEIINLKDIEQCDLFIAFDYYEHFKEPIKELNKILIKEPKVLILANSFGTTAAGHFHFHILPDNSQVLAKSMSRIFNKYLRGKGYTKLKLSFWNDRPAVWVKTANTTPPGKLRKSNYSKNNKKNTITHNF